MTLRSEELLRCRVIADGAAIVRGTRPRCAIAAKCGADFMTVSVALQPVSDALRSSAIVRAFISRAETNFSSARTRYHEIRIRGEAGHASPVAG